MVTWAVAVNVPDEEVPVTVLVTSPGGARILAIARILKITLLPVAGRVILVLMFPLPLAGAVAPPLTVVVQLPKIKPIGALSTMLIV
jgi:hypothetical protein